MHDFTGRHCDEEELENYSLGTTATSHTAAIEEHLIICQDCRAGLEGLEPYSFVHYTDAGHFYSRITKLRTGAFFARHWCGSLRGGKEYWSRQGARAYLVRSFAQMFPEHVCADRCGSTKSRGRE